MKANKRLGSLCALMLCASVAHAGLFGQGDFYSCILDSMPGVANDIAAAMIFADCNRRYPEPHRVERRSGIFARYTLGEACVTDRARSTASFIGAASIDTACRALYDPPPPPPRPTLYKCSNGFISPWPC
ncbi:hypothetical protein [Paraburkholderia sp. SIMBA_030]|uniref:hypothetical protein n=1 Tax=Paraburkholderia sp. SIMBA_030 TaxID=3085773 RepID=UPI00397CCA05